MTLSQPELEAWGVGFGAELRAPVVVTLRGDLGAGKTTLARAICRGFGVVDDVTSPTYALVHEYAGGRAPVHHVDLYRLDGIRDLQNIGWDDLVATGGLLIVEWPERAAGLVPANGVGVELAFVAGEPTLRQLSLGPPFGSAR